MESKAFKLSRIGMEGNELNEEESEKC
jgi:hypothetical protein